MRIVQVVSRSKSDNLYSDILKKERDPSYRKKGSFYQSKRNRWKHVNFKGYIDFHRASAEGIVIFEVKTKAEDNTEWQLLHALIGFLDRHFNKKIESVTILYR